MGSEARGGCRGVKMVAWQQLPSFCTASLAFKNLFSLLNTFPFRTPGARVLRGLQPSYVEKNRASCGGMPCICGEIPCDMWRNSVPICGEIPCPIHRKSVDNRLKQANLSSNPQYVEKNRVVSLAQGVECARFASLSPIFRAFRSLICGEKPCPPAYVEKFRVSPESIPGHMWRYSVAYVEKNRVTSYVEKFRASLICGEIPFSHNL